MSAKSFAVGLIKDWGIALVLIGLVVGGWLFMSRSGPKVGTVAPDFTLPDLSGDSVRLSDFRGQTVVVNFWATWCGPCRSEIPDLSAFAKENPEVHLLGVSVDEDMGPAGVAAAARRLGVEYTVLLDPNGIAATPYNIGTLPTTIVIDADGNVVHTVIGTVSKRRLEGMVDL